MSKRKTILQELRISRLISFFIPLGLAASLTTLSHVIINSTLARSDQPELYIASYAIAMSVLTISERPALLLRNVCSTIVRDLESYRSMLAVTVFVISGILTFGFIMSYSPLGEWLFVYFFNVEQSQLESILLTYRILVFISIFSGLRGLYQGIIIYRMRTKWLTISIIVRLVFIYLMSLYFIQTKQVTGAHIGAIIFLTGIIIEAAISFWEGRALARTLPERIEEHSYHSRIELFRFYRPLMLSSFIIVVIAPAINAMLGKTSDIKLAIASFAIALSVSQLVNSFFTYIHQIVISFYEINKEVVFRFSLILSMIPCLLVGFLSYTPVGPWMLQELMGVNETLMTASIHTLRIFMISSLVFPWIDYGNGLLMLRGQTKYVMLSQSANLLVTVTVLVILIWLSPNWNGMVGALAMSFGMVGELLILLFVIRRNQPLISIDG